MFGYLTIQSRADGSCCEIFVFDDEIQIIPMLKATSYFLAEIENLIYECFPTVKKQPDGKSKVNK